jgi:hypothetical protein
MFSTAGISGPLIPVKFATQWAGNQQVDLPVPDISTSSVSHMREDQCDGFVGVLCGGMLGVPVGEAVGFVVGGACGGPIGAVVGRFIGAVVGEVGGGIGGGFADEWASRRFSGEFA